MAEVTNELIYEILKSIPDRMGKLEVGQREIKGELQAVRGHLVAVNTDISSVYSRLGHVEDRLDRIEKRLGIMDIELN